MPKHVFVWMLFPAQFAILLGDSTKQEVRHALVDHHSSHNRRDMRWCLSDPFGDQCSLVV